MMKKRALLPLLGVVWLSGCDELLSYQFDLVRISELSSQRENASIRMRPRTTALKRKLGAVIENGAPFLLEICFDKENNGLPEIGHVAVQRKVDSGEIIVREYADLQDSWADHGAFSCIHDTLISDEKVDTSDVYCVAVEIRHLNEMYSNKSCWLFERETGEDVMTIQDILNQ